MQDSDYEGFKVSLKRASEEFHKIPKSETIRIIGHLDADGICASAIIINAMMRLNRKYALTTLPALTEESVNTLNNNQEKYFIFVDLGSGSIDIIGKSLSDREVYILDHHHLQSEKHYPNITQLNPHMHGIDGSKDISGAGVVYMFSNFLTSGKNIEMSRIAIVGAIGDIQENNGFQKSNDEILQNAVKHGLIEVRRGLKFFGVQTRPVYKLLQYSSDVCIPGVTGSETGAIHFMQNLGIDPKSKKGWRKIADLSEEEKKKLVAGIIMKRQNEKNPGDIFSNSYLLTGEEDDSPFRDAKEFATLLNSCGRLDKTSIGIGACLNDPKMKKMALENLADYRRELVNALNWYKDNTKSDKILKGKNYIIINAGEDVLPTMIGTLGSILSKSADIEKNIFILSLARNYDDTTKISLRITGSPQINLKDVISLMIEKINHGTAGGHVYAAGAVISTDFEDKFIDAARNIMDGYILEERIE